MKMHRRIAGLSAIAIFMTTLAGCWDSKELDDLSIPLIIAYDTILESEKEYPDDKYLTTAGIPVFYKDVTERFHVVKSPGQLLGEARGRWNYQLGEQVIWGQLQILLIGQELLEKENLVELIDILTRNPRVKASIYVIVVKGRAVDILKRPLHSYPNMGVYLKALIEDSQDTNFYPYTTLFHLNRGLISYETAAILPHIAYENGEIVLAGSCLVNNGKMSGEIGNEETEMAVMLRGIKCRGTLAIRVEEDGKVIDEATFEGRNSRKVRVEIADGKYIFNIQIRLSGIIVEHKKQKPMQNSTDLLAAFEDALEQQIKKRAEAFIEKTQEEFKFDALDLANYVKAYTREKPTKEDIDRIISEAEINVEVRADIRDTGGKM